MTQSANKAKLQTVDPVWTEIRREAEIAIKYEPMVSVLMHSAILNHDSFEEAVISRVAEKLDMPEMKSSMIRDAYRDALAEDSTIGDAFRADMAAVYERDPACERFLEPLLYFKGFQTLQGHRLAHWLLTKGSRDFALMVQSAMSARFQVDINPAVKLGKGIFLDHASGVVIGATAVVGDNVSILQGVTLGGTGKEGGDRHPKIGDGVLIGAGAKVLGNITIGRCARVASGSVVLKSVPPETTVAGVPAKVVGIAGCAEPSRTMNQILADKEDSPPAIDI